MSATTTVPPDVAAYLAAVRDALGDLPAAERDDLVAEVELSILDAASEGGAIAARLGQPEEFAAELREAAGLERAEVRRSSESLAARTARLAADWWRSDPVAAVRRVAGELAPIWWVARGYVAVAAVGLWVVDAGWSSVSGVLRFGSSEGGVLLIVAAAVVSVGIGLAGRRRRTRLRPLGIAVNLALLALAVPVAGNVVDNASGRSLLVAPYQAAPEPTPGLVHDGTPVANVYPFSRGGRLLLDVLLYDDLGRPLSIGAGAPDPDRRLVASDAGEPFYNAFPIRYFEPGTTVVARPYASPPVKIPRVVTPPLGSGSTP